MQPNLQKLKLDYLHSKALIIIFTTMFDFKKLFLCLVLFPSGFTAVLSQDTCYTTRSLLGETIVTIEKRCFNKCDSQILFINLHDNENTSVLAAEEYLIRNGGTLISINNNNERNIFFKIKGKAYSFDPNRIYSEEGINTTITRLSKRYSDQAAQEVRYFANQIITNFIDSSKFIIALHNNTDSSLSVLSYQQDLEMYYNWGKTFINPYMDPDDFVLTTDTLIFEELRKRNINAVWENVDSVSDDGSLSMYAARKKILYVNVEAEHNHLDEQCAMLTAMEEIIKEFGRKKEDKEQDTIKQANNIID